MNTVKFYQIYYDEISRKALDPAFIALDNSANTRPDWREYWPMRQFLLSNTLDDSTYYGFVSPKFGGKTGLTGSQALAFAATSNRDVVTFSPFVEQASFFLNVFEHGEANHPGLLSAMQQFVDQQGLRVNLSTIVCDHTRSIFSNYFVAKAAFWREWLRLGEALFELCEANASPLAQALVEQARYHAASGQVPLKVFVMERLASLVLVSGQFSAMAYDPFAITRSGIPASYLDDDMRVTNALKLAYLDTGDPRYIESFYRARNAVMARLTNKAA